MKCKKCGAEGILVNVVRGYRIYQCPNWEKGTCDYGCFGEVYVNGRWKEMNGEHQFDKIHSHQRPIRKTGKVSA